MSSSDRYVIAGIGNPGREYVGTRHNVGFEVLDIVASRHGLNWKSGFDGLVTDTVLNSKKVTLLKPGTFVNLSGRSVAKLLDYYDIKSQNMLVVVDEFNLPLGKLRLRRSGSAGGHNGLTSIIGTVGREFDRLRIGIGSPSADATSHVLGRFSPVERETLDLALQYAADACEYWPGCDLEKQQEKYNSLELAEKG